jgi:hypothetical protein
MSEIKTEYSGPNTLRENESAHVIGSVKENKSILLQVEPAISTK